jgi:hypothetical protein
MKIEKLHEQALSFAKTYLAAESNLIAVLQEIDLCRGYRDLGCKSLFEYATTLLGLSESVTYNLTTVARKSREIPMLQEKIREGSITLSNARKIAAVITPQSQDRWLAAAETMSKRELEKEIARENPELAVTEKVRPVSENRLELKLGVSEKLHQELRRAQEIVSTKNRRPASLEETIEALTQLFLEKEDPIEKAKRAKPSRKEHDIKKREISASIKHQVRLRDGDQCAHIKDGERCSERKWLDIHHIRPVSDGGLTVLENLTTLCRGHHQLVHFSSHRIWNLSRDRLTG